MASATSRRRARSLLNRRWFAVAVLVLVGLLYYRPLHDFFSSRAQRAERLAEVAKLERQRAVLERKLEEASTPAALVAQERLLGYIRPGEHLFIVKDIPQWRRRQNGSPWPLRVTGRSSHVSSGASRAPSNAWSSAAHLARRR
ncbi:MAG TPA: septum formation initiator family protein [Gaiellaceae bacterium]|nr:septum formation initiator family protein [Gaiellaceae bacterium]